MVIASDSQLSSMLDILRYNLDEIDLASAYGQLNMVKNSINRIRQGMHKQIDMGFKWYMKDKLYSIRTRLKKGINLAKINNHNNIS